MFNKNKKEKIDNKKSLLSKKEHFRIWLKFQLFINTGSSFDRLYGMGFCYTLANFLSKIYTKKEDLINALKRHSTTFITEPTYGAAILGATVAMEEAKAEGEDVPDELITNFKTGLMGPVAGFGDSLNWATIMPLAKAIFLPFAYAGSLAGALGEVLVFWLYVPLMGYSMYKLGYKEGRQSIFTILKKGIIQKILVGASVMGMFMMGVMASKYVILSTPLTFTSNKVTVELQSILNGILPGLLPFLAMAGTYLFLSKKGKYTHLLLAIIVISLILSFFGIL